MFFNPDQAQDLPRGTRRPARHRRPRLQQLGAALRLQVAADSRRTSWCAAGYGIFYATDNFNEEQFKGQGPPFFQAQTLNGDPRTPTIFMNDMLPAFTASREHRAVHVRSAEPHALSEPVELRSAEEASEPTG